MGALMVDLLDVLRDVSPRVALAWGGWLLAGVALALWHVKARHLERARVLQRQAAARLARARPASGVRPPRPPRPPQPDAFGELEALIDSAPEAGAISRRPGD
jgi:hypothetical protein